MEEPRWPTSPGTQDAPIEEGATEATRRSRSAASSVQVREDMRMGTRTTRVALLRQRLADAGISVADDELERYVSHE